MPSVALRSAVHTRTFRMSNCIIQPSAGLCHELGGVCSTACRDILQLQGDAHTCQAFMSYMVN